jgi:hypothetical protein
VIVFCIGLAGTVNPNSVSHKGVQGLLTGVALLSVALKGLMGTLALDIQEKNHNKQRELLSNLAFEASRATTEWRDEDIGRFQTTALPLVSIATFCENSRTVPSIFSRFMCQAVAALLLKQLCCGHR